MTIFSQDTQDHSKFSIGKSMTLALLSTAMLFGAAPSAFAAQQDPDVKVEQDTPGKKTIRIKIRKSVDEDGDIDEDDIEERVIVMQQNFITTQDVLAAQKAWGDGFVAIAKAYDDKSDYIASARHLLDTLYGYGMSEVMFKPTLASEDQFRGSYDEALSYFVKGLRAEDAGFAIKGWRKVRFENEAIVTSGNTAMAMGNYFFTGKDGTETKVEYSFGYMKNKDGDMKIILHHSSLPYQPQ